MVDVDEIINEQGGSSSPHKWDETIEYLRSVIAAHGPFDAIGGFSEGAATAHNLLSLQASGIDLGLRNVRLCLGFSPWISPFSEEQLDPLAPRLLLTSGRQDQDWFHYARRLYVADFADVCMHEFDGEHVYPTATTELRRLCWDMVSTSSARRLHLKYDALQVDGELVSSCLARLFKDTQSADRLAIFAIPGATGHAGSYQALGPVMRCPIYGAIHPHLHASTKLDASTLEEVANMWADSILSVLNSEAAYDTYTLLGASLGGLLAYQALRRCCDRGSAPCSMVLVDPSPLSCPPRKLRTPGLRVAAAYLARQATLADSSFLDEVSEDTDCEYIAVRLVARLAELGSVLFTVSAVMAMQRQLRVAAHLLNLAAEFQAREDDVGAMPLTSTWLVLASEHEDEFGGVDLSSMQWAPATGRLYGRIAGELTLKGAHSDVCQRCADGTVDSFNMILQSALHAATPQTLAEAAQMLADELQIESSPPRSEPADADEDSVAQTLADAAQMLADGTEDSLNMIFRVASETALHAASVADADEDNAPRTLAEAEQMLVDELQIESSPHRSEPADADEDSAP
jgi:thioesterase domain-containing protein